MRRVDAMNLVAEEMRAIMEDTDAELAHYGMPRRSGRYPWGSGEDPYQRNQDFLSRVEELKKNGWTETAENVQKEFGVSLKEYRNEKTWCNYERRLNQVETAKRLRDKEGMGATEIGRKMGLSESTVRSLLNEKSETNMQQAKKTADFLKEQVDNKGMVDVGVGVERELGISRTRMDQALYYLQGEGYEVYGGRFNQVTNAGKMTTQAVLCKPGTEHKEIYNLDKIKTVTDYVSHDDGESFKRKFTYPESLDSKRLQIRYKEDGGIDKDGIIELRRGVDDLSLGESRYSQVRILVDKTHYLKGMAVYSDDMPDGVDVIFNTNKAKGTPMTDVLKEIKKDPDNPFGSLIKDADQGGQYWYKDKKTGQEKLGLINKRADEGDWSDWKDTLPSQFLGKQSLPMAKKQLNLAKANKEDEFNDIMSLNNPTVKKYWLNKFSEECDSAAVKLQAAALPGQKYHVIIPVNTLKDNEVYAPNYENGTKLALVRYPHGGTFEIPILTVNNKHEPARKLLGTDVRDGIGINSKNAERLSGADFDGDTVMCIPTHDRGGKVKVTSTDELPGLKGFDPKMSYGAHKTTKDEDGTKHYYRNGQEYPIMKNTGIQMGVISNLITDMTLAGASDAEKAAAVRHSMVVIDAEKHKLDYKQSEIDNDIAALHKKYQGKSTGGAATILSRSKGQATVLKRQGTPKVNIKGKAWYDPNKPEGALIYKTADDVDYQVTKTNKRTGITTTVNKQKHQQSTRMMETDNAYSLVSDAKHPMEIVYADYANSMKSLANRARKEMMSTGKVEYSKTAKSLYQKEVDSLMVKLNNAELNTVRERAAQRMANAEVTAKKQSDPNMKKSDIKKTSQQALSKYRNEVGSVSRKDRAIHITDKEWEAIQAGAISETKLKRILNNTDADNLRERCMSRTSSTLNQAKINRIKALSASNYTLAEIADKLGVSTSVVSKYLKGVS